MIKFLMAISMAALIASAVVAGLNNKKLTGERELYAQLTVKLNQLTSDLDEVQQNLETAEQELMVAKTSNDQASANLSLAQESLRRANTEVERLVAQFDSKKAELEEFAMLEKKLMGRRPETVRAEFEGKKMRRDQQRQELDQVRGEIVSTNNKVEKNESRIGDLVQEEKERREKVALNGMEADVIAVNREYGFVIVNVGSDLGVSSDASLLVQRGVDRIGRLRIVSVEPKVTVADIIPGTISPGAQIMVRDKVIFENTR
tara:strand:+ start:7569 stop:8348 length:780 start_codon:yes stop_codon:yes gene_type:complete